MPNRVIVLGGGVAGMSAAHELIERGFEVVILERGQLAGGKARSIPVERRRRRHQRPRARRQRASASIEHRLPGEHGFRFFPGFYKHVIATMRRTPSFDGRTAADHLVPTTRVGLTPIWQADVSQCRRCFPAPRRCRHAAARRASGVRADRSTFTPEELAFFGARFWQILTLCDERRLAEYELISWWDFIGAEQRSPAYQKFLAIGFTRSLVAAKADKASARTVGDMFVQMMMTFLNPIERTTDRVLDGPTNLVWIDPWRSYLEMRGVQFITQDRSRADSVRRRRDHRRRRAATTAQRKLWSRRLLCLGASDRAHRRR